MGRYTDIHYTRYNWRFLQLTRISSLWILPAANTNIDIAQKHRITNCVDCIFAAFHQKNITSRKYKIIISVTHNLWSSIHEQKLSWNNRSINVIDGTDELNYARFFKPSLCIFKEEVRLLFYYYNKHNIHMNICIYMSFISLKLK